MADLKGVPHKDIGRVLDIVHLTQDRNRRVGQYSLGMKQRLGIAMALLGSPKLLILDEPTNGLDPAGIQEMRALIRNMPAATGATVLISSHLLGEMEQMVEQVGIIDHGHILFEGPLTELQRHIGQDTDVPAGDIGVGGREIGFMFGQYKRLRDEFTGTLTGKGRDWGGSPLRPEATGYGTCYFAQEMLATRKESFKGKTVCISGSGNVAQYACQKATQLGAKVVTLSDSSGYIHDPEGIDEAKLEYVMELKNIFRGRIKEYADRYPSAKYYPGERPWGVKCDIAMPCATQNELNGDQAQALVDNGCICVAEGANMPSTPDAIRIFQQHKLLFAPGKAANAGGVATSGLEMTQNSMRITWSPEEVDAKLRSIMVNIHSVCVQYGTQPDGYINYVVGANIGGFMKVANAMLAQGCV